MLCNISQNAMRQRGGDPGTPPPPRGGPSQVPPRGRGVPGQVPPLGGSGYPPWGGTRSGTPGGVPGQVPPWGGTRSGTPRGGTRSGTPPVGGVRVPPLGGYPVRWGGYPVRTTEGVLTTRRAVCLLRSRRRTFLFILSILLFIKT